MVQVSVLLPVRDAAPWLASSLASLARQTVADHEVIAVDDGSTDGSGEILDRAARRDDRIVVLHTAARGLPSALNLALARARATWVARHDADDVSHRRRLELQLRRVEAEPALDVLGSRVRLFPSHEVGVGMRRWVAWHNSLLTHDSMRREVLIDSPIAHGTTLIRRDALTGVGGWSERGWAEDLDLWVRLLAAGARFGKLAEPLYGWRQHPRSSTRTDVRYSRERFVSLKVAALDAHLPPGGSGVTLLGVGASLARWRAALGPRVRAWHEAGRPAPQLAPFLRPPLVLAVMAMKARERWRRFLTGLGMRESSDFIFVA